MMLIDESGKFGQECRELSESAVRAIASPLAQRLLLTLAKHPQGLHAAQLARALGVREQNLNYHTRRLRKAGVIVVDRLDESRGGIAKVLRLSTSSFALRLLPLSPISIGVKEETTDTILSPFIVEGRCNCRIIVGSPDPHGPESARARDANYAIDLGLFLGTFLRSRPRPAVVLDTELRDWNQHMIIIGGPVVNKAAARINARSPAAYDAERRAFISDGRVWDDEHCGVIVRMRNPFAREKWILWIAGKRHTGTRAAILAIMDSLERLTSDVTIVLGIDADSDGIIDSARMLFPPPDQAHDKKRPKTKRVQKVTAVSLRTRG
jgi:DNA-binding transcriptional ArsR family regulator